MTEPNEDAESMKRSPLLWSTLGRALVLAGALEKDGSIPKRITRIVVLPPAESDARVELCTWVAEEYTGSPAASAPRVIVGNVPTDPNASDAALGPVYLSTEAARRAVVDAVLMLDGKGETPEED